MSSRYVLIPVVLLASAVSTCSYAQKSNAKPAPESYAPGEGEQIATFAGGCFWCMEGPFEELVGVRQVVSGYAGGKEKDPAYKDVAYGRTGHTEAVRIVFDPKQITYADLVEVYWRSFDPTDVGGQFADRGKQYRPAIFVHDAKQRKLAEASKKKLSESGVFDKPILVPVEEFTTFYPAEIYHQDYYKKNPGHYKGYRRGSGREGFLERTWKNVPPLKLAKKRKYSKPSDAELRERLTEMQYDVTQRDGTEPPFQNEYWDNKREGIYVDVASGEPLFSSKHKFKSGTGWPSFYKPLVAANVVEKADRSHGMTRVEVRSKHGDSHLGHVFKDGPAPTGLRYCINSAALRFVPVKHLAAGGYGEFAAAFGVAPKSQPTSKPATSSRPSSRPSRK